MTRVSRVYGPIIEADQWKALLARPERHWRIGYSARALAHSWLDANGLPAEIRDLFRTSGVPAFNTIRPLIVIPEHKVWMPPRAGHPSQNDLFVLAKAADHRLMAITVEGKVSESFDKTIRDWMKPVSEGKRKRLSFLAGKLALPGEFPHYVRYQLVHRLASAILEAERFGARYAAMVVHSFSQSDDWFADFRAFVGIFGHEVTLGQLAHLTTSGGIPVYAGWARGDPRYLAA